MTDVDYQPQRERLAQWAKQHYIDEFNMHGSVLDAGCGDGFWLSIFVENGMTGVGLDPNAAAILKGRKQWPNLMLYIYSIEDACLDGVGGFDTVFCRGVSPFYLDIAKAEELTEMMLMMGDRMLMSQYTNQTNERNAHGHWMWSQEVYFGMVKRAGGMVRKWTYVQNYLQLEIVHAIS